MIARCEFKIGFIFSKALRNETKAIAHLNIVKSIEEEFSCLKETDWFENAKNLLEELNERHRLEEIARKRVEE